MASIGQACPRPGHRPHWPLHLVRVGGTFIPRQVDGLAVRDTAAARSSGQIDGTIQKTRCSHVRELLLFVLLGLLLATPGEILNQILARNNVSAFRSTLCSYAILLLVGFFVSKVILAVVKKQKLAAVSCYLLFGSLGLAVEWCLLGNAPVLDVLQFVTQPGMFTYWGTLVLGPRLLMDPAATPALRWAFVRFFLIYSSVYLLVAVLIPRDRGGVFFAFIIFAAGTTALNYFYIKFFQMLTARFQQPGLRD